jgi:hypothetical protein
VKRLREGLKYTDSTLRHPDCKLSPLGVRVVFLYEDTCGEFMDLEEIIDPDENEEVEVAKEAWLTIVRMHEKSAQYKVCLAIMNSSNAQTLQDEIVKPQLIAFFARYNNALVDAYQKAAI